MEDNGLYRPAQDIILEFKNIVLVCQVIGALSHDDELVRFNGVAKEQQGEADVVDFCTMVLNSIQQVYNNECFRLPELKLSSHGTSVC